MKPTADTPHKDLNKAIVLRPLASAEESVRDGEARLLEAVGLAQALGLEVAGAEAAPLRQINPRSYFGSGRVERLKDRSEELGAGVIVIDAALSPVQQRNLETDTGSKVIDRTGLILEIFGLRARTKEGKLQVELARQGYERSRLVRTWTHLERQRGGLGKTGGPGETQIELDRRIIADRIIKLKRELEDVRRTRGLQRRARSRAGLPAVVLVGYTNAGKSTLFNRLTQAGVLAKDMLFATLDPTARKVQLPSGRAVIMSDTVGFISDLPHELVESFRATLEAVTEADLLVHVRDIAHPQSEDQKADVLAVLAQLAKDADGKSPPVLEAWNKIDLLDEETRLGRLRRAEAAGQGQGALPPVALSAETGEGVDALLTAIDRAAFSATRVITLTLAPDDAGRVRAQIASAGKIIDESTDDDGNLTLRAELLVQEAARFAPIEPLPEDLRPAAE
ncbi:GTPase HflX [Candidatus Viadribacter manganicus]|uniref:GTPase HflX n=1 Tax=Candidatus Viadribacter manganicus TaxID=1759059 RepID=UPI0008311055|nr:GTPase HflX [Candidatus Viadribacter manganicus]